MEIKIMKAVSYNAMAKWHSSKVAHLVIATKLAKVTWPIMGRQWRRTMVIWLITETNLAQ